MGRFNIIQFIEHIDDNTNDTQIIILYDEDEGNFRYYGTRHDNFRKNVLQYEGKFHYTRLNAMVDFISFLVKNFHSRITTEFHQINIAESQYDMVDYSFLKTKLTTKSELAAYNTQIESYDNIHTYLETLISHEI